MRRRSPGEVVEPYRRRVHAPEGHQLRDRLAAWADQNRTTINTYPIMPDGITDRNADVWESLFSLADAAGGPWPEWARVAAVALVADAKGGQPSLGLRLLGDLRTAFTDKEIISTEELLSYLICIEESPWGDLKGKPLDPLRLSEFLKPYGIKSKVVRVGTSTPRGYTKTDFHDAWARYLSVESIGSVGLPPNTSATCATSTTEAIHGTVNSETGYPEPEGLFAEEVVCDDH